ncbi:MAG: class I SAM-dependent methyltransferase [Pseudomonadota bacterium]
MHEMKSDSEPVDLDDFYSSESPQVWKQIIGESLHYHSGYYTSMSEASSLEAGAERVVRLFYPYIEEGATLLDAGCGWGGPGKMLVEDRKVNYTGITISQAQVDYCQQLGLNVCRKNLETDELPGSQYDVVVMIEAMQHIMDKQAILAKFRDCSNRLLLTVNLSRSRDNERVFGGTLKSCSYNQLETYLQRAGWKIDLVRSRRAESYPTLVLWSNNLKTVYGDETPPGQLRFLRDYVNFALSRWVDWCPMVPLVDVVASPA